MTQRQLVKKLHYQSHFDFLVSSFRRLFSTSLPSAQAISENPPIKSPLAVEYLVNSCGLPMDKAIKASKNIPHLRSPEKPDSVLQFLREIGISDADIRITVTSDPRILCASLEKNIKPRVMEIRELGFSPSQIARLFPLASRIFRSKGSSLQRTIEFWTPILGSLEGLLDALKRAPYLLTVSAEKVVEPNISFLQEHCGVCPDQIRKMIMRSPQLVTFNPNKLKEAAERAEELGSPRGSGLFIYALQLTLSVSPNDVDAKLKSLKKLGFSQTEISSMIRKFPLLLTKSDGMIRKSIDFLTSEAGLDLASIALRPKLIAYSLERRIVPRHYVLKSLRSKGLCENLSFPTVANLSEKTFAERFVGRYKDIIPEVFEAYEAARDGRISLKGKP